MKRIKQESGFSLIEAMIALVLGILVLLGIVQVFSQTGQVNRVQDGLARLQENARYALWRVTEDIRMTGSQHCSTFANIYPEDGQHRRRTMRVLATDAQLAANGMPTRPAGFGATDPFLVSPRYFLSGHECDNTGTCLPDLTIMAADGAVPDAGTAVGERPPSADVLTLRYFVGDGLNIAADVGGTPDIQLPSSPSADPLNLSNGDLAMIADCTKAEIFVTQLDSNNLEHEAADGNITDNLLIYRQNEDARVVNVTDGLRTVSYFLQVKDDPVVAGEVTTSLWRSQDGVAQEIVEGVERFDVLYGVEDDDGNVAYITADEVESRAGGTLTCPPEPDGAVASGDCLWNSVRNVEVTLLFNTVANVSTLDNEPYRYTPDGPGMQDPSGGVIPGASGITPGRKLRREFRALVSLRNFNY